MKCRIKNNWSLKGQRQTKRKGHKSRSDFTRGATHLITDIALTMGAVRWGGAMVYPTLHPVHEKVLPDRI